MLSKTPSSSMITLRCPCCRQTVASNVPLVDLTSNTLAWGKREIRLSPREADVLHLLVARMPRPVTYSAVISHIYGMGEPDNAGKCVQVFICHLRARLRCLPELRIETIHARGYRLVHV